MPTTESRSIPPYIGWATWNRLLHVMKTFVPPKLDRSYFSSAGFSGTQYSQAVRAFLFLRLMDDEKRPTETLRQLVMGTDEQKKTTFKSVIEIAYKPFFENPGPQKATLGDLTTFLRRQGAKGVVDKCATFFIAAAKEADVPLSPHLAGEFGRKTGRQLKARKKVTEKHTEPAMNLNPGQNQVLLPAGDIDLRVVSYVAELPEGQQEKWIKAYVKISRAMKEE